MKKTFITSGAERLWYGLFPFSLMFTALKGPQYLFLFAFTAAGVVPYGGPKCLPVHHP